MLFEWLEFLDEINSPLVDRPGVLHSFSGNLEDAHQAVEAGLYLGITGPVTFKNAPELQAVVSSIPLERLLIETDSPYLAPVPMRGQRNEPAFVVHVAKQLAELKGCPLEFLADLTASNAKTLFAF